MGGSSALLGKGIPEASATAVVIVIENGDFPVDLIQLLELGDDGWDVDATVYADQGAMASGVVGYG